MVRQRFGPAFTTYFLLFHHLNTCDSFERNGELHVGWRACRATNESLADHGCAGNQADDIWNVSRLPTTALTVLIENKQFSGKAMDLQLDDLYFSTNLQLYPDIHEVGREFYTLLYEIDIVSLTPLQDFDPSYTNIQEDTQRQILRFAGINYRATAWLNGTELPELEGYSYPGMFRRRSFDVTKGGRFTILIEPPDHPGIPVPGQGGNHELAMDGAVPQYMLGWDWCQAMPDRATGFYGSVTLEVLTGGWSIQDAAIQTVELRGCSLEERGPCSFIVLRALARMEGQPLDSSATLRVESDWGESWLLPINMQGDDVKADLDVKHPELVDLWWPHGVGMRTVARLHEFTFTLFVDGNAVDTVTIQSGVRTIETSLDSELQGQRFKVNGHDIYLVGGNWIGTDQALRYSASKERYCSELQLHRYAGLNLIRVWGGGTAERDQFYDCADRLGLFVFQEFQMTGDNNGRWAGNYSWPSKYDAYLANVKDTVLRLRRHSSLLFYGGCNECLAPRNSTWYPSPPSEIDDGIRAILKEHDPGRFYISSSMGGRNAADTFDDPSLCSNRTYSLASADGPYSMLLPATFFQPNPGLPTQSIVGFQPEIGSVSSPTYRGLLKMLDPIEIETGYPRRALGPNNTAWEFHKFQSWTTNLSNGFLYDHVYAYFGGNATVNARDWTAAAQLAAHAQYQSLFNGFISNMFRYTTAVILWKSQSPWPSLRGFMYDFYLESTGTLRGVRSVLGSPITLAFDQKMWRLHIMNRQVLPLVSSEAAPIVAIYEWIDLHGTRVAAGETVILPGAISSMTSFLLGTDDDRLEWPSECTEVCFLRLEVFHDATSTEYVSWYWLTNPIRGEASDYSALGELRQRQLAHVALKVQYCLLDSAGLEMGVQILVDGNSADVLFYPTFSIEKVVGRAQLLPMLVSNDTDVVLLPGSTRNRILQTVAHVEHDEFVRVILSSWNAADINQVFVCERRAIET